MAVESLEWLLKKIESDVKVPLCGCCKLSATEFDRSRRTPEIVIMAVSRCLIMNFAYSYSMLLAPALTKLPVGRKASSSPLRTMTHALSALGNIR